LQISACTLHQWRSGLPKRLTHWIVSQHSVVSSWG
jgi:hypothetical protein